MTSPIKSGAQGYDDFYREFDLPLTRQLRSESYGRDIGQHSWVTAEELEADISRLRLTPSSRLLDLGCGPGGPLTFLAGLVGCRGVGTDISAEGISVARVRAASLGLGDLVTWQQADLNEPIPLASGSFDAVMSLDVILHLRDRLAVFKEVRRLLTNGGRFLFTDAGVITGPVSNEEVRNRAAQGDTQFVPPGFNERMLDAAGFQRIDCTDRTANLLRNASGRLSARLAHKQELQQLESASSYEKHQLYLETVVTLSQRGAVSRMMYLAEPRPA
jgi:cyclopropane fatty-acyl-phospholipid synthase-like methyltransferase